MTHILKKSSYDPGAMRVSAHELPLTGDKILGIGIDITTCPDGHLSCPVCQSPYFEVWCSLDAHRLEIGCCNCGWSSRILVPYDVDLLSIGQGRFGCKKHPKDEMVIIKNCDILSIGCRKCGTEVDIKLKTKSNLVLA